MSLASGNHIARLILLLSCLICSSGLKASIYGQHVDWSVNLNGNQVLIPEEVLAENDVTSIADFLINEQIQEGYFEAHVLEIELDSLSHTIRFTIPETPRYKVGTLAVNPPDHDLTNNITLPEPGQWFSSIEIQNTATAIQQKFLSDGYWLGTVSVDLRINEKAKLVDIVYGVTKGRLVRLDKIALQPAGRTTQSYVHNYLGLKPGDPIKNFDPEMGRLDLERSGLFDVVGTFKFHSTSDSTIQLTIPAREKVPGNFDVVLGYLPGNGDERGVLVGSGRLLLQNVFGGGRLISALFDRNPGSVRRFSAHLYDPMIGGSRILGGVRFNGEQRDSTFNKYTIGLESGLNLDSRTSLWIIYKRSRIRPGNLANGQESSLYPLFRAGSHAFGIGFRFNDVDYIANPSKGWFFESTVEQVRKSVENEFTANYALQTVSVTARTFVPVRSNHILAFGTDFMATLGEGIDASDLFRFGGATTLRGYNEEQFEGEKVGRLLAEYRLRLDATSFAFVFGDLGYVQETRTDDVDSEQSLFLGYGFGIRYGTPAGIINLTYATNPSERITSGKVHVGISLGL